jgi:hypothetical protein
MYKPSREVETIAEFVKGIIAEGGKRGVLERSGPSTGKHRTDVAVDGSLRNYNPVSLDCRILYSIPRRSCAHDHPINDGHTEQWEAFRLKVVDPRTVLVVASDQFVVGKCRRAATVIGRVRSSRRGCYRGRYCCWYCWEQ